MTVDPWRSLNSVRKLRIRRCIVTSSPSVGSSRNMTSGRCSSELAISAFISLAEREVAHRLVDERPEVEQLDQLVALRPEHRLGQPVDGARELEAVERRQIPLELVAVA